MNDVRQWIYGAIIGLLACIGMMVSVAYVSACGFTLTCIRATPLVIRTPVPTLIPAAHPQESANNDMPDFEGCQVAAQDLIGAWVTAGSPETEAFPFEDVDGESCEGTFANDVQDLFIENSAWYPGQLGCTSCHNAQLTDRNAGLDLSSYRSIMSSNILGSGKWESSRLHAVLFEQGLVPQGHSPDADPLQPLLIYAGRHVDEPAAAPTATP